MAEIYSKLKQSLKNGELVALATVLQGPGLGNKMLIWPNDITAGSLGNDQLDKTVLAQAQSLLKSQQSQQLELEIQGQPGLVFVEIFPPPLKLIIIGAVHIAMPLVTFANELGFQTIVIDARAAFATEQRFSHADEMIVRWPADALGEMTLDEATYLVFLSHDEKMDNPALAVALRSKARYIGALGAEKTHSRRMKDLQEMGFSEAELARIHAPIGLDVGAQRPEEIAVSIIAQIVKVKNTK